MTNTETPAELAERYVAAFMGDHESATVYRERLVAMVTNAVKHGRDYLQTPDAAERARVFVDPWAVLYAVRYGLPRATYAHADAIRLIIEHAPSLRQWADTLIPDIRLTETNAFLMACADPHCRADHDRAIAALAGEKETTA
ncbi:hypothetical protein [Microbacterium sp.]|uniref:hypothetical protein n=1 Tax=Microbacterium sp. TaxID=51671 RepID=UPI003F70AE40